MNRRDDRYDNVVNLDGSRYREGKEVKRARRGILYKLTPEVIGAGILILVFLYLLINVLIYRSKKQVSVFEVQSQDIGYKTSFPGICLRDEHIVTAENSGYLNYYIGNGCKVAKNGVVYSVDTSNKIYNDINSTMNDIKLTSDEITRIKNVIASRMRDYNGSDLSWLEGFKNNLNNIVYEMINENVLNTVLDMRARDNSSGFTTYSSPESGVISYFSDNLTGYTADRIDSDTFKAKSAEKQNLRTAGLVASGNPVYRICPTDNWNLIVKVSEDFYVNNLEKRTATVYINGDTTAISGDLRLYTIEKDYFAELSFDKYMTRYMNERYVNVEFASNVDAGLKIPVSAIFNKGYYLVPLTMFVAADGYNGMILKKEIYDPQTGTTLYENIYPEKYYSDGYYAYIEMDGKLSEGDYLCNDETGERVKIGLINYLEGVYNVNKGYYIFMRIEKLRSNSEYAIVKSNTPDGLRQYDHIALNASDAVDQALIY